MALAGHGLRAMSVQRLLMALPLPNKIFSAHLPGLDREAARLIPLLPDCHQEVTSRKRLLQMEKATSPRVEMIWMAGRQPLYLDHRRMADHGFMNK